MIRTGLKDISIRLHWVTQAGRHIAVPSTQIEGVNGPIYLAHFDAISFQRWARKFARRAARFKGNGGTGSGRREWQRRMANTAARLGQRVQRWLFRRLYCITPAQMRQLAADGLLVEQDLFGRDADTHVKTGSEAKV